MHGRRVEIWLNGVRINDYTSNRNIAVGHIGVQNDGARMDISYRDIRVRQDSPVPADLARDKAVEVSSVEPGSGHAGANAVDGDTGTRWGSAHADPQSITVDPGSQQSLRQVRLHWEAAHARSYEMQSSTDNVTWQRAYSTTAGDGEVDEVAVKVVGRYVRVLGTQRATQWATRCGSCRSTARDGSAGPPAGWR